MALTLEQMTRLDRLFEQVLDLDRAGRERWLKALPESEHDLLPMLRRALLEDPLGPLTTLPRFEVVEPACAVRIGQRIGPYTLIRRLGKGGMAQVWLARRADGAYEREVALKLPVALHAREDISQRFARERDILAALEHPHIARFYDAGVSHDGLPYLALEYVPGKTLVAWCDTQKLGMVERIRLFLPILDAVQYSHARGVLHRDIKPSNVMVTDTGQVRLLDFGVARMLEQDDATLTRAYGPVLTLEYASPEQLNDESLSPASDVYSLGVLLFELLTGRLPHRPEGTGAPSAAPVVEKPSTQLDPPAAARRASNAARLRQALRGDLDAIVLKALARDPARRYASVADMAQDLKCYLDGKPVQARGDSPGYRWGWWLWRYRITLVASAVMLLLAAGAGYRLLVPRPQAGIAGDAFASAPGAAIDKSIAVLPFLDLSEKRDQEFLSDGLSEEVIDHLAQSADLRVISRTSSFYFKGKQATVGEIARALGVSYVLEGSVRRAGDQLRVTVQLIRAADGTHLWSKTYDPVALDVLQLQSQIATAVTNALQATLLGDPATASELGGTQNPRAYDAYLRGKSLARLSESEENLLARIGAYQDALRLDPGFAKAYVGLADAQRLYASNYALGADVNERLRKSRAAAESALRLEPHLGEAHAALAETLVEGFLDFNAALSEYERAVAYSPTNADVLMDSGLLMVALGQVDAGLERVRRAVSYDQLNGRAYRILTQALIQARHYPEAIDASNRLQSLDPTDARAPARRGLAQLLLGRYEAARQSCEGPRQNWVSRLCLAIVYNKLHQREKAQAQFAAMQSQWGDTLAYQYVQIYAQWGETAKALDWLETAYRLPDPGMFWIKSDPLLEPLGSQPRFVALLKKLKLERDASPGAAAPVATAVP